MDVGESVVAALEAVGELRVLEAEQVQDRGLKIVDMDRVFGCVETEFVGRTVDESGLDAATCEPDGKCVGVMIASVGLVALDHRSATKLAAPNDERVVEESPLFEVGDERGRGLVGVLAVDGQVAFYATMLVPRFVEELHKADAAFDESTGEQAIVGEGRLARFGSVEIEDMLRLVGQVGRLGGGGLHTKSHFVGIDARGDFGIANDVEILAVQGIDRVERIASDLAIDARRAGKVEDRVAAGTEFDAGVYGRQKSGIPGSGARTGAFFAGVHHDKRGQVACFAAEAIGDPRTHRGSAKLLAAGVDQELGRCVVEGVADHRANDADVVQDGFGVWEQLGDGKTVASGLFKFEPWPHELGIRVDESGSVVLEQFGRRECAVEPFECRLVVEHLELAWPATHKEVDDSLCLGRVVRHFDGQGIDGRGTCLFGRQESRERHSA